MVRVDIETIVMAAGPVPSLIVLRERSSKSDSPATLPPRLLPRRKNCNDAGLDGKV